MQVVMLALYLVVIMRAMVVDANVVGNDDDVEYGANNGANNAAQ